MNDALTQDDTDDQDSTDEWECLGCGWVDDDQGEFCMWCWDCADCCRCES